MARKKVAKKVKKKKKVDGGLQKQPGCATIEDVEEAIKKAGGFISIAARTLGVTRQAIWKRVKKSARLKEAIDDIEEKYLDLAESELVKAIDGGERWAITFYLRTKGKKRGYVEGQELTGKEGKPLPLHITIERSERVKETGG